MQAVLCPPSSLSLQLTCSCSPLQLKVINKIPKDFPSLEEGITIHWHGFDMRDGNSWYDGASFINSCPIQRDHSFTYRFVVNEMPGSYMWHGHAGAVKVDGLAGPLIVLPKPGVPQPVPPPVVHKDFTIFLMDWYHSLAAPMTAGLNR